MYERDAIPTLINQCGCKCPQIKGDIVHFKLIFIVSFQVQCAGVQIQKNINCTTVQRLTNCTACTQWPVYYLWLLFFDVLVFCCCSQLVRCVVCSESSAAYNCCNTRLIWAIVAFLSIWTSLDLLLWPLSSTRHFHSQNCCLLEVFCFSHHSLQIIFGIKGWVQSHFRMCYSVQGSLQCFLIWIGLGNAVWACLPVLVTVEAG